MQAIDVTYQWSLMELTEDQYYASKDENMDKLPNFKKFILGIGNIQSHVPCFNDNTNKGNK